MTVAARRGIRHVNRGDSGLKEDELVKDPSVADAHVFGELLSVIEPGAGILSTSLGLGTLFFPTVAALDLTGPALSVFRAVCNITTLVSYVKARISISCGYSEADRKLFTEPEGLLTGGSFAVWKVPQEAAVLLGAREWPLDAVPALSRAARVGDIFVVIVTGWPGRFCDGEVVGLRQHGFEGDRWSLIGLRVDVNEAISLSAAASASFVR